MNTAHRLVELDYEIYELLVQHENDVVGMLAFALHKRNELRFMAKYNSRHLAYPDDEVMIRFREDALPKLSSVERDRAEQLAFAYSKIEKITDTVDGIARLQNMIHELLGEVHTKIHEKKAGFFNKK